MNKKKRWSPVNWYDQSIKVDLFQKFWHKKRFAEVSLIIDPVKGSVLDVDCNDGTFTKIIFEKTGAKELIGIDLAKKTVDWANRHWKKSGMSFLIGDAQNLKFKSNSFDAVFCLEVLEHVNDPLEVLKESKRVMKKGGYGIFLVPSDSFLFRAIWYLWLHFYPRGWVWRHTHIQTDRKNCLTKICKQIGFKIEVDKKFNLGMLHLLKVRK